jgi:hypothetical protein
VDIIVNQDLRIPGQQTLNTWLSRTAMLLQATRNIDGGETNKKWVDLTSAVHTSYDAYQSALGGPNDLENIDSLVHSIWSLAIAHQTAAPQYEIRPRTQHPGILSPDSHQSNQDLSWEKTKDGTFQAGTLGGFTSDKFLKKMSIEEH